MGNRAFWSYVFASTLMSFTAVSITVAVGWHIYQLTGEPFDLALVGLMEISPMICLFLVTGMVIDKFPRKQILVLCALVELVMFLLLAWVMNAEVIQKQLIFACLLLHGATRAFHMPTSQAVLPNIVDEDYLGKAVAISSTVKNVAFTSGPFVTGLFIAWLDHGVYWLLLGFSSIAVLLYLRLPYIAPEKTTKRTLSDLVGGISFVRNNPYVLGSISLDLLIVLAGSVIALLPIYAIDVLQVGAETLGLMRAMPAIGAVMVGIVMSRQPPLRHAGKALFLALLGFVLSIFVFAWSTCLWLSLLALWAYGATDMVSVNVRTTLIQLATPNELRGRVSAVNSLFIAGSNKLGDFRAGAVASVLSPVSTVALGGLIALGVTVGGYFLFPQIRKINQVHNIKSSSETS